MSTSQPDFLRWVEQTDSTQPASLLTYVAHYAPPAHEAALLRAVEEGYRIDFVDFDWRLNDQKSTAPTD